MDSTPVGDRLPRGVKSVLQTVIALVIALAVIAVGELLPPLRALDTYIRERPSLESALQIVTLGMAVAGTLILALAQFLPAPRVPESMTREELDALSPPMKYREDSPGTVRWPGRWTTTLRGGVSGEASVGSIKQAWRLRSWRYHRRWLLLFVMMLGAVLLFFGLFGFIFVIGSPGIKLLMGGALLYAVAMVVWALSRTG
jgi:hypothetical protein